MKTTKLRLFFIVLISISLIGGTAFFIQNRPTILNPDYTVYDSESDIVNNADTIIVGKILNVETRKIKVYFTEGRVYKDDEDKKIYTVSKVKVSEVIKGDLKKDDIVEVKQLGDGEKIIEQAVVNNGGYFVKDTEKVLFLKSFKEHNVPYSVLNPIQGQYAVENGLVTPSSKENKLFVQTPQKTLAITQKDASKAIENGYSTKEFIEKVKSYIAK